MSSKLIVEICKVDNIIKHPNANKLSIVKIKGWNVIVGLDQYKIGDLVVYCPPDSIIPDAIIEEFNLEFLKKCGRVGTIKLRKFISQGLVLNVPKSIKKPKEGMDVAKIMNITKWEPPASKFSQNRNTETLTKYYKKLVSGEMSFKRFVKKSYILIKDRLFKRKKKLNPLFDKYTSINNIKNYPNVFKDGDEVVITEKIHGCLYAETLILLSDGTSKTIKEIVETKFKGNVLGMDESGNLISSKITNWFNNGKTKDWIQVIYKRPCQRGHKYFTVKCTNNHMFYLPDMKKYISADKIKKGYNVLCGGFHNAIPYHVKEILTGMMLGDGCLQRQSVVFSHKQEHIPYMDYILKSLGHFAGNYQKQQISGYGTQMFRARSISSITINNIFKNWFIDNKKQIPDNIILSPISLAFWYMDDGSLSHHDNQQDRLALATNGFNEKSIDNLLKALLSLGIVGIKYESKGWRIRINKDDAQVFFTLVSPYITECMQYKLPKNFRGHMCSNFPNIDLKNIAKKSIKEIIDVKKYNIKNTNTTKYDIETETHNFFANKCLVHNSNARFSWLPKKKSWRNFSEKFEFCIGSHNVQLVGNRGKNSFYGSDVWSKSAEDNKLEVLLKTYPGYLFYGEVYGFKIQDLEYGLDDVQIRFFDIKDMNTGQYLDDDTFESICKLLQLPTVPLLYKGPYSAEVVKEFTNGKSLLYPNQIREGCVIRSKEETIDPRVGRKMLKSISENYLLRKNATEFN